MNATTETQAHLLVVADVWCKVDGLCDRVRAELAGEDGSVLVLAPPLTGRLHTHLSDTDGETAAARQRLDDVLRRLRDHGVVAHGQIGDADPIIAIDDVLATFPAEEIVLVTEADGHQNWRERRLPEYLWKLGIPARHWVVPHEQAQ